MLEIYRENPHIHTFGLVLITAIGGDLSRPALASAMARTESAWGSSFCEVVMKTKEHPRREREQMTIYVVHILRGQQIHQITPTAQYGAEGSVRLLLTKNPPCSLLLPY